jgi:hypothetical protein
MRSRRAAATLVIAFGGRRGSGEHHLGRSHHNGDQWYVGGTTVAVGRDLTLKGKITQKIVIGGSAGRTGVKVTATGLSCSACKITNGVVTSDTTPTVMAMGRSYLPVPPSRSRTRTVR